MNRRSTVESVADYVAAHPFSPIENGFTVDPETGYDGVSDHDNTDWRTRTLALRDLVRIGPDALPSAIDALSHSSPHVRQIAAMSLGILGAEPAQDALELRLESDPDPVVRSHAAIALGQLGRPSEALVRHLDTEEHTDVHHQCRVALDRIEKKRPVEPEVSEAFAGLNPSTSGRVQEGDEAPDVTLEDTEGNSWQLSEARGEKPIVLLWVFADWCPVCHKEFHELIERKDRFEALGVEVATLECHDRYRCRGMVGKELRPSYWFDDHFPDDQPLAPYPDQIWWPHLVDRGATAGLRYGVDPWQFAVHSEWVNRPTTVIIDADGIVRLAYAGNYWGDRPSIGQILRMIETKNYTFEAPPPRRGPH